MKKLKKINPDMHFRVLSALEEDPHLTQRALSKKLGVSLGGVNYCLKELIKTGQIKLSNFEKNSNKLSYFYILTPKGFRKKATLTTDFLKRKMIEYHNLKEELDLIQSKLKS